MPKHVMRTMAASNAPRALRAVLLLVVMLASVPGCGMMEPSPATACQQAPEGDWEVGDKDVPDVTGWTPEAASDAFEAAGIDVSWRYEYATEPTRREGYSECWCVAPPDGVVEDVAASDEGWLVVMVMRREPMLGGRPQPETGWGCGAEV